MTFESQLRKTRRYAKIAISSTPCHSRNIEDNGISAGSYDIAVMVARKHGARTMARRLHYPDA